MFEIPRKYENLMDEYFREVVKAIELDPAIKLNGFVTEEIICDVIKPLPLKVIESFYQNEVTHELWFEDFCDDDYLDDELEVPLTILVDYIESSIGEEYVVFENMNDKVFLLQDIEDYISVIERSSRNKRRIDIKKVS